VGQRVPGREHLVPGQDLRVRKSVRVAALVVSLGALVWAVAVPGSFRTRAQDTRPNIVLILTDDQTYDTLPSTPPSMPWLQRQIIDPSGHWIDLTNAFINTPLCCPSRATILTGQWSHHTGVLGNRFGDRLNQNETIATWLHAAGYWTGLVGKYLNAYPFGEGPFVPPGWDRWFAKENESASTVYYDYPYVDNGIQKLAGDQPQFYATDFLANQAVKFIQQAPATQPFFLYFATSAPHDPWVPPPRYRTTFQNLDIPLPPDLNQSNVSGMPPWIRALPRLSRGQVAREVRDMRRERECLLAVDDAVREVIGAIRSRGDTNRTVIFYLTDNGYSFGEHRWMTKECPYEECIRTPFAVDVPGVAARTDPTPVSNADLAPTMAALAGIEPGAPVDGANLVPLLTGTGPAPARRGILIEWAGFNPVPRWWGIRTANFAYIETAPNWVELYDITGRLGPADPFELHNVANRPRYSAVRSRLAAALARLRSRAPTRE
jgi:N-acetylglucosamine-6-sulfatase